MVSYLESTLESAVCIGWPEVHLFLDVTIVSGDFLLCQFVQQGTWAFGFDAACPGVFLSQPSPCYAQETENHTAAHGGTWLKVSRVGIVFPSLRCVKTLLWQYSPCSWQELATVPNSRVGSGSGSDLEPNRCNGSYHTKTRTIAIGPVLPPKTRHFNTPSLAPIKYLSSDRIMT
jgi:hypothetical protein